MGNRSGHGGELKWPRAGKSNWPLATALTIHAVTGADIPQLALIRGIDIDETATTVKVHCSTAHRRCRLYPLPTWTRRLARAAGIHGQLNDRSPDSPLFPLITVQDGEQLRLTATGIRYHLKPTP
ncbi:hypothetical protein HEP84_54165 [Streptomyces sp. RLB1-33]|nr:hypothetical protein [Streptomyces sp. RLB1-33]QIY76462.1 hypothetical protein HEP84_54165 [Streptomyces sp. RLB1-33]